MLAQLCAVGIQASGKEKEVIKLLIFTLVLFSLLQQKPEPVLNLIEGPSYRVERFKSGNPKRAEKARAQATLDYSYKSNTLAACRKTLPTLIRS